MFTLHENEQLISVSRKAPFLFATTVAGAFLTSLIPVVALLVLDASVPYLTRGELAPLMFFIAFLWWTVAWIWLFSTFVNLYLDVFLVTTERVIHVAQYGFFHREVSELRLSRVQDVTVLQKGLLATFLGFGDIRVETAGETQEFSFFFLPKPHLIKDAIMSAHRDYMAHEHNHTH